MFLLLSLQPCIEVSIVIAFYTYKLVAAYQRRVFNGAAVVI
jgi:hypothetical protein